MRRRLAAAGWALCLVAAAAASCSGGNGSGTQYVTSVRDLFPTKADRVLAAYPLADYASGREALVAVTTDFQFTCPARTYAKAAATRPEPVYRYLYTQVMRGGSAQAAARGAAHGLELYFVFQHLTALPTYTPTNADTALESTILGYWTSIAATTDPNAAHGPAGWPEYDPAIDPYLELGTPVEAHNGVRTDKCDFWDALNE